jgi:hypothetical protein
MNQDTTSFNLGERRAGLSDSVRLTLDDLKEAIVVNGDIPGGVRMERRNPNRGMIQSSGVSPTSLSVLTPSRTAGFFCRPPARPRNPPAKKVPSRSSRLWAECARAGFCHESRLGPISIMPRGPTGDGQTRRVSSATHRAPGRFLTDPGLPCGPPFHLTIPASAHADTNWRGSMDADALLTNGAEADGEVVWS